MNIAPWNLSLLLIAEFVHARCGCNSLVVVCGCLSCLAANIQFTLAARVASSLDQGLRFKCFLKSER